MLNISSFVFERNRIALLMRKCSGCVLRFPHALIVHLNVDCGLSFSKILVV